MNDMTPEEQAQWREFCGDDDDAGGPQASKPMTLLDHALAAAAQDFHVFPLLPNRKVPPKDMTFKTLATRDRGQITKWWTENPNYNIGIYAGRYGDNEALLILDPDQKKGKDGLGELAKLQAQGFQLPPTRIVTTPTGGQHLYFRVPQALRQGVSTIAPGVDTRSKGGYVVGPGSVINGKPYTLRDAPLPDAPTWVAEKCGPAPDKLRSDRAEPDSTDDATVKRAIAFLGANPPAIEGQGGDLHTYKTGCRLRDFGVDRVTARDLMMDHWNDRCEPPWTLEDMQTKVWNAYDYGENDLGCADPRKEFTAIEPAAQSVAETITGTEPERAAPSSRAYKLQHCGDILPKLDKRWLLENVLAWTGIGFLFGTWGEGKTAVVTDIAMAVARGIRWDGLDTEQGVVLYASTEGTMADRIAAYLKDRELDGAAVPFTLIEDDINLFRDGDDTDRLIQAARETKARWGAPVRLLVVDNLSNAMAGGDENSAKDTTLVRARLNRIARETGAFVLMVAHTGKNEEKGLRGSSNLGGMADAMLHVGGGVLTVTKVKDAEDGKRHGFKTRGVTLGTNARGKTQTAVVIDLVALSAGQNTKPPKPGSHAAKLVAVVEDLTLNGTDGVTAADVRAEFRKRHFPGNSRKDKQSADNAFRDARSVMKTKILTPAWKVLFPDTEKAAVGKVSWKNGQSRKPRKYWLTA